MNLINIYSNNLPIKRFQPHKNSDFVNAQFYFQKFQKFNDLPELKDITDINTVSRWNFISYIEVEIGLKIGEHQHYGNEEFYFILEGKATIHIDGESKDIKAGDLILTRSGSSHYLDNVTEKLKFLAIEILID